MTHEAVLTDTFPKEAFIDSWIRLNILVRLVFVADKLLMNTLFIEALFNEALVDSWKIFDT